MTRDLDRWNALVLVEDPRAIAFLAGLLMATGDEFDRGFGMGMAAHVYAVTPTRYPGLPTLRRREFTD